MHLRAARQFNSESKPCAPAKTDRRDAAASLHSTTSTASRESPLKASPLSLPTCWYRLRRARFRHPSLCRSRSGSPVRGRRLTFSSRFHGGSMLLAAGVAVTHRTLAPVDLVIIAVYFVLVFGIGFYFSRKERTSEDYFLAGRNIGWFAIGASLFVSNISTEHFIGLAGSGATSGLAGGNFEWQASCILLLLGWVFVPFYLRSNVFTMPEFLERRFNRNCPPYLASISIIAYIFTKISVHLYAAAIVLE